MSDAPSKTARPLSWGQKLGWGTGAFTDVMMTNAFSYLLFPIYNVGLHVDPRTLGWVMSLPRFWEAISDPAIGHLSDNARTRWGRRKPFVVVGALFCGLFFALAWMPPMTLGPQRLGWYLLGLSICYYTAYAAFTIPWNAMGLEMSDDYHGRTGIQAVKSFLQAVGGLLLGALWWLSLKWGQGDAVAGVKWVGLTFGLLIALAGVVAAKTGRENPAVDIHKQEHIGFMKAVTTTFRNGPFLMVVGIVLLILIGIFLIQPMALYINILHVYGGDDKEVAKLNMVMNFIFQGVGFALTPAVAMVSRRLGKKTTLAGGLLLVALGYFLSWWTYTPAMPYLQMVTLGLCAPGLASLWIITPSMVADLCDVDELATGRRREGMYMATYTWVTKAGLAVSLILSGYLLTWSGYNSEAATQAAGVVRMLRIYYMAIPTLFALCAFLLAILYPITQARVVETRRLLNDRH